MKFVKASYEILSPRIEYARDIWYKAIERAGRTCYKSESGITNESAAKFVANIVKNHHEAMLEHVSMTVKFIVDRGVSHEMVRHRLASFAQESTRYCNYSAGKFGGELTFVEPVWFQDGSFDEAKALIEKMRLGELNNDDRKRLDNDEALFNKFQQYAMWRDACSDAEWTYKELIGHYGWKPEQARSVLPNSLKTEIVVTANAREWRHILNLRAAGTTGNPHPQIAEVMVPLAGELATYMPELFGDIAEKIKEEENA